MKVLSWKASLILLFGMACFTIGQVATAPLVATSPPVAITVQNYGKRILSVSSEGKLTIAEGLTMDEAGREFIIVLEKQFGRQLVDLETPCSPVKKD